MMNCPPVRMAIVALLAAFALPGCALFTSAQDRLLSVDHYHVRFKPSQPNLTPAQRTLEATIWRAQVRNAAAQVAPTVSARNVYGDQALWDSILTASNADVTRCRARNTDVKGLRVIDGAGGQLTEARVQASAGDFSHVEIPNVGPCTVADNRKLRTLDIVATSVPQGVPRSSFVLLEARVGQSNDAWTELDFATLTVTYDPGPVKGGAQFAFVLVRKPQGWESNFEEVIVVPRGSYFGDVKLLGQ